MMRLFQLAIAVALTCAASLGIVALSWHHDALAAPLRVRSEPTPLVRARGTLEQIDDAAHRVTIRLPGTALELAVAPHTTVFVDGRMATLADLQPGTPVCAAWEKREQPTAEWLEPCGR